MKTRVWFIALLLGAGVGAAHAADEWQVVLLKPRGCNACTFVEEILKRRAQLQQTVLDDGAGNQVTAAITRRSSVELGAQEWLELRALPYFDELGWRRQVSARAAQVLLKRNGVIVAAGDISESADLRNARFPAEITTPDAGGDLPGVHRMRGAFVSDLYLGSWNLNWFYRLALDPSVLRERSPATRIAANADTLVQPLGKANVVIMSTASGAADNEIFNALRIEEIRDALTQSLSVDPAQLHIFYGGGAAGGANALELRGGRTGLIRRNVDAAVPFTPEAGLRIFQSIRKQPGSRNLLVLVGHGGPEGAGMWGSPTALSPAMLRAMHDHGGGDDVLVSGNCFGGVMARATSCGFFGARPDIVATGCQADAAEVAQSRDYLHMYFSSLTPAGRKAADANEDGAISFAEAHWYASIYGDQRNVTYTSIDALADAWFESSLDAAPRSIAVREILVLAADAPVAEARALRTLLAGHDAEFMVSLWDLAGQAARWKPDNTQPRTVIAQLVRRLLFLKDGQGRTSEVARLQSCENREVAAFLKP